MDTKPVEEAEEILGMFMIAFGRGVPTGVNVRRSVVGSIRAALLPGIQFTISKYRGSGGSWEAKWQQESNTVLALMEAVGVLAAHLVMNEHQTVINPKHFTAAFDSVRATRQGKGGAPQGEWCM
jgi:hypothetical protein